MGFSEGLAGAAGIFGISWVFVVGGRFRRSAKALSPVEFEWAKEEAEAMFSGLAPDLITLAERERMEEVFGEAASGVWVRFAVASATVEDDPLSAIEELRELAGVLDGLLTRPDGIEGSEGDFMERSGDDGTA